MGGGDGKRGVTMDLLEFHQVMSELDIMPRLMTKTEATRYFR
jgi:hypothetical protein